MYPIYYGLIYAVSLLPWFVMYGLGDLLYLLAYHVFGYRKKVVLQNLEIAFPEKSEKERRTIARRFYRNFTDTIVESIKVLSMSEKELDRRFLPKPEMLGLIKEVERTGKTFQIHAMHNFNWEIVNHGISRELNLPFLGVYMPLHNRFFERLFRKIRSRYGTMLVPATEFKENFERFEKKYTDKPYAIALVADQSPGNPSMAWWVNFFSRPTGFVHGPEKAARDRNLGVIFGNFYKVSRGQYTFDAILATENASSTKEGELTLAYVRYVEECIRKRPENYLWSHRRWKHAYKPEYAGRVLEKLNLVS
jgi:KDO2-lipid IV(A) lauroyltransferase